MRRSFHLWLLAAACLVSSQAAAQLTVTFLDVGQGDAALIRSPTGRNVLIDAGQSPTRVAEWLRASKVDTIHLLIASHNHADHIGGIPAVLTRIPVLNYMENGMPATTRTYARITTLLEQLEVPVLRASPRRIDLGGGAEVRVLEGSPNAHTQNDASIGIELAYGSFRAFFTGDAEGRQRNFWARDSLLVRAHVLKVSHHGSVNGTDSSMVSRLRPCAAVISVGANNGFGHPSPVVLRLLRVARVQAFRTDVSGRISVTADSTGAFTVATGQKRTRFESKCQRQ